MGETSGPAGDPSFARVAELVEYYCVTCHVGPGTCSHAPDLQNDQGQLYETLTTWTSPKCGDRKLVDPGNPDNSAIVLSMESGCGELPRMPYGCAVEGCQADPYLPDLRQWILDGAPQE